MVNFIKNISAMKKVTVTKLLKDAAARTPTFSAMDYLAHLEPPGDPAKSAVSSS